jgi:ribosomal protein S3
MGQKVHPIGFRIGITKKHQVQWFAPFRKYKYSQTVLEDCMIRDTLTKLFPLLLNPTEQKKKKRDDGNLNQDIPRISMIRIERGLIPYEIGIQVHAENCEILKASINNLKGKQELTSMVEKSRSFLTTLKSAIKSQYDTGDKQSSISQNRKSRNIIGTKYNEQSMLSSGSKKYAGKNKIRVKKTAPSLLYSKIRAKKMYTQSVESNTIQSLVLKNIFKTKKKILEYYARLSQKALNAILEMKNTKTQKGPKTTGPSSRTQKLNSFKTANSFLFEKGRIVRRLRERLKIRKRGVARLFQGVVLIKKGNTIIRQYLKPQLAKTPHKQFTQNEMNYDSQQKIGKTPPKTSNLLNSNRTGALSSTKGKNRLSTNSQSFNGSINNLSLRSSPKSSIGKKKFLSILSIKFDNNFLKLLKKLLLKSGTTLAKHREKQLQTYGFLKYAPLGFNRFWSLNNINKFKQKPKSTILKLIRLIEQKAFAYLVSLRKDYKQKGGLSFSKVFAYYQIIRFLQKLKQIRRTLAISTSSSKSVSRRSLKVKTLNSDFGNLNVLKKNTAIETNLKTKLQNIENECKKTKFITYLQQLVQKHRERNIYQYLRTISESKRSLKTLKQFVLAESNTLFGVDLQNNGLTPETTEEIKSNMKSLFVKPASQISGNTGSSFGAIFAEGQQNALRAIEKEMQMHQRNLSLIPKITIKFFNVKPSIVANRPLDSKASFLALSIVDQLEKRKAFRKVIKDAKQNSMKHPKIKGIKIQVSGRLNGAEIARSEWVRAGRVPLQTLRANIDYSYKTAKTIYGIIGVRIWIFKGYTL